MRVGSLFSGIGGLDLGLERAGMEIVWQVENDDWCCKVLERHWPHVQRYGDVRELTGRELAPVDLICGGFPCTQTSVAAAIHGRRSGLYGQDSGLWYEMLRLIRALHPRLVLVENVAGIKTWQTALTRSLEAAGYAARWISLSAWSVGAPHLRRRMFCVADINSTRLARTWCQDAPPPEGEQGRTANRDAWLSAIPRLRGVAHGVPSRVDRLRGLGNAVVPQVAEVIGRWILTAEAK